MEINFYHLTSSPINIALPQLIVKILGANKRALLIADESQLADLSDILWKFEAKDSAKITLIPNGVKSDGFCDKQPVYLTSIEENLNSAQMIVNVGCIDVSDDFLKTFTRCLYIFDDNNSTQLENARINWKAYKEQGDLTLSYWKQENGKWNKTA